MCAAEREGVTVPTAEIKKKLRHLIADMRKYFTAFYKRVSGAAAVNTNGLAFRWYYQELKFVYRRN